MFEPGEHNLKNGWVLMVSKYQGSYKISKPQVYEIKASRITGGQWGDGLWTIDILRCVEVEKKDEYIPMSGGFDIETCNNIIDKMEELMLKYDIKDYSVKDTPIKDNLITKGIKSKIKKLFHKRKIAN